MNKNVIEISKKIFMITSKDNKLVLKNKDNIKLFNMKELKKMTNHKMIEFKYKGKVYMLTLTSKTHLGRQSKADNIVINKIKKEDPILVNSKKKEFTIFGTFLLCLELLRIWILIIILSIIKKLFFINWILLYYFIQYYKSYSADKEESNSVIRESINFLSTLIFRSKSKSFIIIDVIRYIPIGYLE